ncbi:MAG TPA: hypothetical protein VHO48_16285, partial [Anaerolineaceae bacterium]|nr:hypothetical protein [Anaerolineaceae bacterium]
AECGMLAWLLAVYGSIALFCSVLFRQAKGALIASILAWMLLRPAVMALLVFNPLGNLLGWSQQQLWQHLAFLPEFAFQIGLEPARGVPQGVSLQAGDSFLALGVWALTFSLLAGWTFLRQDEAN